MNESRLLAAGDFLFEVLALSPLPARDLFRMATEAGHSETAIRRAAKLLGIRPTKNGLRGGWIWPSIESWRPTFAVGDADPPKAVEGGGEDVHGSTDKGEC